MPRKLHLICHGMMVFWYRKPLTGVDDGYTIYMPQGLHQGALMHHVRLGLGAGARKSWLELPAGGVVRPTRHFKLEFGAEQNKNQRGHSPDEKQNLSFYERPGYKAELNPYGVSFTIETPYPHGQEALRLATYVNDPYTLVNGKDFTARNLEIAPRRIVATRVLTFNIADDADVPLKLVEPKTATTPEREWIIAPAPLSDGLKLHLYSQPIKWPGPKEDHTDLLNDMMTLVDMNTVGNNKRFDLELNSNRQPTYDPDPVIFPCFTFQDYLHLFEYYAIYPFSGNPPSHPGPHQGQHQHPDHGWIGPASYVDPAECGQGGGC